MKSLLNQLSQKSAATLLAGLSIAASSLFPLGALAQAAPQKTKPASAQTTLPNGVYLYGQSAQRDQIGQAYFVFEVRQGKLVGGLYMPRSSFDCTYGSVQPDKVALTVVGTYDKVESPYEIATVRNSSVASRDNPAFLNVGLEGFQRINKLSDVDRHVLSVCKTNYQQRVWK